MIRALITGTTGFIGRNCLQILQRKDVEVHGVSSQINQQEESSVRWHQVDLMNPTQITDLLESVRPTHLLHCAWITTHGEYWHSRMNLEWLKASLHLAEEFIRIGGERIVMAGTCAEYNWHYGFCSEETTPLSNSTLYAASKNALKSLVGILSQRSGVSWAWGRIFFPYGPHDDENRLLPYVITSLLSGQPARCSEGSQIRDFIYVKDVASAFIKLLQSDYSGTINIGSGRPVYIKDIILRISEKLGRRDLVQLGSVEVAQDDPPLIVADVTRLNKELGWHPEFDLESGLEETIDWWEKRYSV